MNKLRAVPRDELEVHGMRVIESAIGDEIAYVAFDEDAEFIVKACNAHEQLVEALKELYEDFSPQTLAQVALDDKIHALLEACK